jgi:hypothetical protein
MMQIGASYWQTSRRIGRYKGEMTVGRILWSIMVHKLKVERYYCAIMLFWLGL